MIRRCKNNCISVQAHTLIAKIARVFSAPALAALLVLPANSIAGPVPLSDSDLDAVSAGFVELTVDAVADATGPNPDAIAFTNVDIQTSEADENGDIFTVATGDGIARARGETVFTAVGYQLDTDETIVSFDLRESLRNSEFDNKKGKSKNKNRKNSNKNKSGKKNNKRKNGKKSDGKNNNRKSNNKKKNSNNKKKKNSNNKKNSNKKKNRDNNKGKKYNRKKHDRGSKPESIPGSNSITQTQKLKIRVVTVRNINTPSAPTMMPVVDQL